MTRARSRANRTNVTEIMVHSCFDASGGTALRWQAKLHKVLNIFSQKCLDEGLEGSNGVEACYLGDFRWRGLWENGGEKELCENRSSTWEGKGVRQLCKQRAHRPGDVAMRVAARSRCQMYAKRDVALTGGLRFTISIRTAKCNHAAAACNKTHL